MGENISPSKSTGLVTVQIHGLRVMARIGVHESEQITRQELVLHAALRYDATRAARSDALADAFDYQALTRRLCETAEQSDCDLLERLLDHLLMVMMEDERVLWSSLEIVKPGALARAQSVSLSGERSR